MGKQLSGRRLRVPALAVMAALAAAATSASVLAGRSAPAGEIGAKTVGGMKLEPELEDAQTMQMLMGGKWMMQRPGPSDTHHFEVALIDPKFGGRIPYAGVTATFVNLKSKATFAKRLDPMYGDNLHYGANVKLAAGDYKVTVNVRPPSLMREGEGLNRWLRPVRAEFRVKVS